MSHEQPGDHGQPDASGTATASMVLGICAVSFSMLVSVVSYGSHAVLVYPAGVLGLVLGLVALRRSAPGSGGGRRDRAVAGVVLSVLGLLAVSTS